MVGKGEEIIQKPDELKRYLPDLATNTRDNCDTELCYFTRDFGKNKDS